MLDALAGTGLVAMSGSSGVVNATAFTLGGGTRGSLARTGFASNSLRAIELLTADGRHRWLRDADEPELLWASRGAGGAFGVVTAIEIDLHPAPRAHRWSPRLRGDGCRGGVPCGRRRRSHAPRHARPPRRRHAHPRRAAGARRTARADDRGRRVRRTRRLRRGTRRDRPDPRGRHGRSPTRSGRSTVELSATIGRGAHRPLRRLTSGRHSRTSTARPSTDWSRRGSRRRGSPSWGSRFRVLGEALAAPPARPAIAGAVREGHVVSGRAHGRARRGEAAQRAFDALHAAHRSRRIRPHLLHLPPPGAGYTGAYAESDVARAANVKATVDPEGRFRGNRDFS